MKRLHNRWRPLPAVATDHAFHRFECSKMLLGVETVAAWTALCFRDQAAGFVIAHLLDADVSSQCQILCTQIGTSCHVKLPAAFRDFFQLTPFFLPHRTRKLSLNRTLSCPYASSQCCSTLQLGIGVVQ